MDGIGLDVSIEYPDWTGLDWIHKSMDWFGLRLEKWIHVQVCVSISEQRKGYYKNNSKWMFQRGQQKVGKYDYWSMQKAAGENSDFN